MPIEIRMSKTKAIELFKHCMIGNWILSSNFEDDKKEYEKYENFQNWFLSIMKNYDLIEGIEYEEEFDEYFMSNEIEGQIYDIIHEFTEEYFWENLAYRLAERDFEEKYSAEDEEKMSLEERYRKILKIEEEYIAEIEENGLENIKIV